MRNLIPHYEDKWEYLVGHSKQQRYCPIARLKKDELLLCTDLHHKHSDSKWAVKAFPLFIQSMVNLVPLSRMYHQLNPQYLNDKKFRYIYTRYQAERWEKFLERHPMMAKFVNNPNLDHCNWLGVHDR